MDIFLFYLFKTLIFIIVILGLLLGYYLLARFDYLVKRIFPKEKPKAKIFFSKNPEESDKFVLYYFFVCFYFVSLRWDS